MKTVLIATTNNDKYNAVKKVFQATIFPNDKYKIDSLKTLNIKIKDCIEVGDNLNRARDKAIKAKNELKDYNFDYVVGLDDAIMIKGKLEPDIKKYLNKILYEDYLNDNEEYGFSRAYVIIDKNDNIYETTALIPYIYKNLDNDLIEYAEYPLSQVSYPIGYNVSIDKLNEEEELNYYLKYVKDSIMKLNIK